jgi:hypothetical protein
VAAHGELTFRTTVAIVAGGTLAALLGAFLFSQFLITLPLQRMARTMTRMAAGDRQSTGLAVAMRSARWHGRWRCSATMR